MTNALPPQLSANVHYKLFEGFNQAALFAEAAAFASEVGPKRLIGISHSEGVYVRTVVTVWYWTQEAA